MYRILTFTAITLFLSCKKNDNNNNNGNPGLIKQFHKSIAIGESYYGNPDILYAFKGDDQQINIIYPESDQLKWVQFNNESVTFKKMLQPTGSFNGFWSKGFSKNNNGDLAIVGTYWETEHSSGSTYLATADEKGNLLNTKVISPKSGGNIRGDMIYPAHDGGYFIASTAYGIFNITRLNRNAEVEWRKSGLSIDGVADVTEIKSLTEDSKGNIFTAALMRNIGTSAGIQECVIKMKPDGDVIWIKSLEVRNLDAHVNSDYNIKYLITDEHESLYAFEEFHFVNRIMITKFDTDGNILEMKTFDDNTTGLYDVQYRDQSFYLLVGGYNPVKVLQLKMDQNLSIVKKGVVLAAGDLSGLPGKFFKSSTDQSTDYIIAGKDEWDNNAWQYVRLDDNWKYPCYDYIVPNINLKNHTDFSAQNWDITQFKTTSYTAEDFLTTDAAFELKARSNDNMIMGIFCER